MLISASQKKSTRESEKMVNKKQPAKPGELYFGMQAEIGITKHMGGKEATKELIELCRINKDSYILDVGCGIGKTPCYISKEVGCRVVGVDLYEGMVKRSKERAKRKHVEDKVEFKVGDALKLPFKDNTFDAVICESVIAFLKDKQGGINEFVRVTKPGGYVGINEVTWTGTPTQKSVEYMARLTGADFLDSDGWKKLLEVSGLRDIAVKTCKFDALKQLRDEISWMELRDFFGPWYKVLLLFTQSQEYRNYIKGMVHTPLNITKHMGHGIYAGRK